MVKATFLAVPAVPGFSVSRLEHSHHWWGTVGGGGGWGVGVPPRLQFPFRPEDSSSLKKKKSSPEDMLIDLRERDTHIDVRERH